MLSSDFFCHINSLFLSSFDCVEYIIGYTFATSTKCKSSKSNFPAAIKELLHAHLKFPVKARVCACELAMHMSSPSTPFFFYISSNTELIRCWSGHNKCNFGCFFLQKYATINSHSMIRTQCKTFVLEPLAKKRNKFFSQIFMSKTFRMDLNR